MSTEQAKQSLRISRRKFLGTLGNGLLSGKTVLVACSRTRTPALDLDAVYGGGARADRERCSTKPAGLPRGTTSG
jgi:hypothetical protein